MKGIIGDLMEKFGLLGEKLTHSMSPEIHKEILKSINKKGSYDLIETSKEKLNNHIKNYKGLNVTIPYKIDIISELEDLSQVAKKIGAVNTIYKNTGYNTDYFGFKKMLEIYNIDVKDKKVYILGTGGASKAVYQYLVDYKAKSIVFISRNKKGKDIIGYEELENINGDIIINTTPVGMYPKISNTPVDSNIIEKFSVAIDLIYNPIETKFLEIAKKNNLTIINGLYMLIGQAVKAQEIWQEEKIDNKIIEKIYLKLSKE